jgi:hypothetical protein
MLERTTEVPDSLLMTAREYIARVRWTFAKTMPRHPHEYTVRQHRPEYDELFCTFVEMIRRYGYVKKWDGRTYVYLDLDGWSYWTMGNPISETTIINRAV